LWAEEGSSKAKGANPDRKPPLPCGLRRDPQRLREQTLTENQVSSSGPTEEWRAVKNFSNSA